jgi:anti-anti-sigma factor
MKITLQEEESFVIATVEGSLSTEFLRDFEVEVERLIGERRNIIVDFSRLSFILSSGLSSLLSGHVEATGHNLRFIICGLNSDLEKLFSITDLNKHLDIVKNLDEAREMLAGPAG